RRRHTRSKRDWSSDVCSSDLMCLFVDIFWDKIKENRNEKKAIYLDEIWRLIGVTSNKDVASFIYKIFKTIRKYGGSGVAITQDRSEERRVGKECRSRRSRYSE